MTFEQFRDFCITTHVQRTMYPNCPKYSETILDIASVKGYEPSVKPKDMATIDHFKCTPGSLILTPQYAHAQMVQWCDDGMYMILSDDGKPHLRCWMLDGKPEHWTSIIPIKDIYDSLIPKRKK